MPRIFERKLLKYFSIVKPAFLAVIFFCVLFLLLKTVIPIVRFASQNNITPQFIFRLIVKGETNLKNYKGITNIALLGISGGGREGADLTDTIMILSLNEDSDDVVMLSLPRDLWMKSLKDKINTAYHYGEKKKPGGGFILAKSTIEEVINQPIQYAVLIDFSGFKELIDIVGGLDITIEQGFEDKKYPIPGRENDFCAGDMTFACRYEVLKFSEGLQHMNGDTALKYVRSRHAEGDLGTDYDRSRRQQQILTAFKDKILAKGFYTDLDKVKKIFQGFESAVKIDMDWSEKISLLKRLNRINDDKIRKLVLDDGNIEKTRKGFLVNPPLWKYDGAWVLEPRTGDFQEIQEYIFCQLKDPNCQITP